MVIWQLGDDSQEIVNIQTHDAFHVLTVQVRLTHAKDTKKLSFRAYCLNAIFFSPWAQN